MEQFLDLFAEILELYFDEKGYPTEVKEDVEPLRVVRIDRRGRKFNIR